MIPIKEVQGPEQSNIPFLSKSQQLQPLPHLICVTNHQLDCTYYGQINKSYQRQGFGILQTLDFDTYFGFWKSNKAEGLGLIIYHTGTMLYGNFMRNQLFGPVILDDKKTMIVTFFEGVEKVGLTYQYTYADGFWRILSYQKDGKFKIVREEHQPLQEKIPDIIAAEHSLNVFMTAYLAEDYFKEGNMQKQMRGIQKKKKQPKKEEVSVEKYSNLKNCLINSNEQTMWLGFKDGGTLNGLGCVYKKAQNRLLEAGYYKKGLLHGCAFKYDENNKQIIGRYEEGARHGYFIEPGNNQNQKFIVNQYREDSFYKNVNLTEEAFSNYEPHLEKKLKSYQFQFKDFLSAPNIFDLISIHNLVSGKKISRKSLVETKEKNTFLKVKPVELTQKKQSPSKQNLDPYISDDRRQKTSLEMIRGKILDYELVNVEKQARVVSQQKRKGYVNSKARIEGIQEDQEAIAEQQNPFDNAMLGVNLINQSPSRLTY